MADDFRFEGIYKIEAELLCITGLHIGGSKDKFEIGGLDNPVIKTNFNLDLPDGRRITEGMPYIPGSSLKGKIRSLLEWRYGMVKLQSEQNEINVDHIDLAIVFGTGNADKLREPTRIKFDDAYPTKDTIDNWKSELGEGIYTESKIENLIDRITSKANPRQQERVPAGSKFQVEILFKVLKHGDHKRLKLVFEGMKLLEDDFLGGGGSRGNGRVKFEKVRIKFRDIGYYQNKAEEIVILNEGSVDQALDELQKREQR